MNTLAEKVTSRLYRYASGVCANTLRFQHADLSQALEKLGQQEGVAISNWDDVFVENADSRDLATLFDQYGSDKAGKHNYHLIYASLLNRHEPLNIFEIGLGTNSPGLISSMGKNGKPGAAERAFRDWAPMANIFGADIDTDILFAEDRIQTFFVDQTKPETLAEVATKLPALDLVIDDGLHTPLANLNSIQFALPLLRHNGALVIEDIRPCDLPFWSVAIAILSQKHDCQIVAMKSESVVIIKNRQLAT